MTKVTKDCKKYNPALQPNNRFQGSNAPVFSFRSGFWFGKKTTHHDLRIETQQSLPLGKFHHVGTTTCFLFATKVSRTSFCLQPLKAEIASGAAPMLLRLLGSISTDNLLASVPISCSDFKWRFPFRLLRGSHCLTSTNAKADHPKSSDLSEPCLLQPGTLSGNLWQTERAGRLCIKRLLRAGNRQTDSLYKSPPQAP